MKKQMQTAKEMAENSLESCLNSTVFLKDLEKVFKEIKEASDRGDFRTTVSVTRNSNSDGGIYHLLKESGYDFGGWLQDGDSLVSVVSWSL
jgi:hypothetical protein